MTHIQGFLSLMRAQAARFGKDRRGAVAMIYALVFIAVLSALGVGVDLSNTLQLKYRLDLAADAAAIACGEAWQTDMEAGVAVASADTDGQTRGVATFNAQAGQLTPQLKTGSPTVVATDGVASSGAADVQCTVNYTSSNPTYIMRIVGFTTLTVSGSAYSTVNLSPFAQVYLIVDTSASMMVGSTAADNALIAAYAYTNQTAIFGGVSPIYYPCSFSCHEASPLTPTDMQQGETNAHAAGATTRFDVMVKAFTNDPSTSFSTTYDSTIGEGLLPYIRDTYQATNARANLNTFKYYVYGFNNGIDYSDQGGTAQSGDHSQDSIIDSADLSAVAAKINSLTIGFMTHFNPGNSTDGALTGGACPTGQSPQLAGCMVGPQLVKLVGAVSGSSTPGSVVTNPKKFVILVSDGMNSDRTWDFGPPPTVGVSVNYAMSMSQAAECARWAPECTAPAPNFSWNKPYTTFWNGTAYTAGYAGAFDTAYCDELKSNGAIVAVLETPYVPLYGQNPYSTSGYPYELVVQSIIYPNGPGTTSTATIALQNCASSGYYYQATSNAAIANGFITLFNKFVGEWVHVTK